MITVTQIKILEEISKTSPINQITISKNVCITPKCISENIRDLETKGLVKEITQKVSRKNYILSNNGFEVIRLIKLIEELING